MEKTFDKEAAVTRYSELLEESKELSQLPNIEDRVVHGGVYDFASSADSEIYQLEETALKHGFYFSMTGDEAEYTLKQMSPEQYAAYLAGDIWQKGDAELVIVETMHDGAPARHFYVEQNGERVADLFGIPASTIWNGSMKRDVVKSIKSLLRDAFPQDVITDLQDQAWEAVRNF
jgi:hypothetical protein